MSELRFAVETGHKIHNFIHELENFTVCQDYSNSRITWCFFSLIFFVLGATAYIFILHDWYKKRANNSLLTPNAFFNLNLSVMDLVFLVFIPVGMINQFLWHSWVFESFWNGVYALSVCGRPFIMVCICVDCYLAVVHPLFYRSWTTLAPRVMAVAVVWLFTLAVALTLGLNRTSVLTELSVLPYAVAVVIIIVCDCLILSTLKKSGPGGKNIHPQKQRAIQTVVNSFVLAVFTYIPPVFVFIIGRHLQRDMHAYYCSIMLHLFLFSTMGSAVMPFLFLQNIGGFKRFQTWFLQNAHFCGKSACVRRS